MWGCRTSSEGVASRELRSEIHQVPSLPLLQKNAMGVDNLALEP